jgi:hypothetical protein
MSRVVDRLTGEAELETDTFKYVELGAFEGKHFRRNVIVENTPAAINQWRTQYLNTGIFRSMLYSNCADISLYDDEETLFYGDLCFDLDVSKDFSKDAWDAMLNEVEYKIVPALKIDFGLARSDIRVWFSGGRGLHVEVPAELLQVWPHHDLNRIYGYYARQLVSERGCEYLDLSLYGARHLYRLEHSIHQRSNLYKIPVLVSELPTVRKLDWFMKNIATKPRKVPFTSFGSVKAPHFYDTIVRAALALKRTPAPDGSTIGDRSRYQRSRYQCVENMLSEGFTLSEGSRHSMVYFFANHLRQSGFDLAEARQELAELTSNHCSPPLVSRSDLDFVERTLYEAYRAEPNHIGCSYVQRNTPSLCTENTCPLGQYLQKKALGDQPKPQVGFKI